MAGVFTTRPDRVRTGILDPVFTGLENLHGVFMAGLLTLSCTTGSSLGLVLLSGSTGSTRVGS